MGGFKKEPTVQDLLRKQMQEREFDDGDGGAGNRPGGGGDGSGGSEDEGFAGIWDEFVQVFLATVGFIFLVTTSALSDLFSMSLQKFEHLM